MVMLNMGTERAQAWTRSRTWTRTRARTVTLAWLRTLSRTPQWNKGTDMDIWHGYGRRHCVTVH